jgi:hypothetical protein
MASSFCQNNFYDGFLLMLCNFKFKDVLLRSDSKHNDIVDSLLECATNQAVMTVAQWHRQQNVFKFKIAQHKQKSIVKIILAER